MNAQTELTSSALNTIQEARSRISAHIHRTPVMTSESLDQIAGARLYFKCENLQKTGSFKIRGATNAVLSLAEEEAQKGVATHSSGNHGAALSLAAKWRGIRAYIVMPSNSSQPKKDAVRAYGGEINECGPTLEARETAAAAILARTGANLVHPYNDARVISGQGTAALELLEEVPDLDMVIAPISGGGLLSGTALAAQGCRPGILVVGAEPRNADDAHRSLASGKIEPASSRQTIADGLRATLCPLTFSILRALVNEIALVEEEEIAGTMRLLWERMKMIVEPSGAVAAAPAITRKIHATGRKVGIILSGGNLDLRKLPF
jgi:threonine dehydratase